MELFELVLLLLGAVLVSAVLDEIIPRVSLPLVQIAIGAAVAVAWAEPLDVQVDPELFLVLFIAPLLFDESRRADKRALWDNREAIVSLAVGLVLLTVLVVGFVLHWIKPSIPLAAAFALGAALGPTDAVAVMSLSKDIRLSKRQKTLLSGEALINDASGVVSFQFAIAAAATGAFSLVEASASFAFSFFGGIILGLVLGLAAEIVLRALRSRGLESTTLHVVFEVCMPFFVFLTAEHLGVSGILAVVAAGLLMAFFPRKTTSDSSRIKIVSSSVWDVLVFVINGVVFVLLGMELALLVSPTWDRSGMSRSMLVGCVMLVTLLVVGVRFLWVLGMEAWRARAKRERTGFGLTKAAVKSLLVTTLAGPKGAVTLSIAFTIPYYLSTGVAFPHRNDLIFLASGVIVCTLLLANFVVPLLAPKEDSAEEDDAADRAAEVAILRNVIAELTRERDSKSDAALRVVAKGYEERIARIVESDVAPERLLQLRREVVERQRAYVQQAGERGDFAREACDCYSERLDRMAEMLGGRRPERHAQKYLKRRAFLRVRDALKGALGSSGEAVAAEAVERYRIAVGAERCAVEYLASLGNQADADEAMAVRYLLGEHHAALRTLETRDAEELGTLAASVADLQSMAGLRKPSQGQRTRIVELEAEALRLELEQIQSMKEQDRLSRDRARALREEVYLLQMGLGIE